MRPRSGYWHQYGTHFGEDGKVLSLRYQGQPVTSMSSLCPARNVRFPHSESSMALHPTVPWNKVVYFLVPNWCLLGAEPYNPLIPSTSRGELYEQTKFNSNQIHSDLIPKYLGLLDWSKYVDSIPSSPSFIFSDLWSPMCVQIPELPPSGTRSFPSGFGHLSHVWKQILLSLTDPLYWF